MKNKENADELPDERFYPNEPCASPLGERRGHDGAQPGGAGGHAAQHQAGRERPPAGGSAGRRLPAARAGTHHAPLCSLPLSDMAPTQPLPGTRSDLPAPLPLSSLLTQGCYRKSHSQGAAAWQEMYKRVRSCAPPPTVYLLIVGVKEVKVQPVTQFGSLKSPGPSPSPHILITHSPSSVVTLTASKLFDKMCSTL